MRLKFALAPFVCALTLGAQSTLGVLTGYVTETSGASIAGANICLIDLDRHFEILGTTGQNGAYEILNVPAGRYEIQATHPGLTTAVATFRLLSREALRVDLRMELRPHADKVDVSATVPLIDTENGTISDTKSGEQILRLPLNFRATSLLDSTSPTAAMYIVPGILEDDRSVNGIFNGSLLGQAEYTIDGIASNSVFYTFPSSEILSEFKVSSANNPVDLSRPVDITLTTRSGTDTVHGAASWYHQNAAFDAGDYFHHSVGPKVYNNFAAALGGPAVLPRLYTGRHRTFFFVDFQGDRQPAGQLSYLYVPTQAWRSGDLTGLPGGAVVDPLTGKPFPGDRIPDSRINTVPRTLLSKYLPLPNSPNNQRDPNYIAVSPFDMSANRYDIRVDQRLGSKQMAFVRWSWSDSPFVFGSEPLLIPQYVYIATRALAAGYTATPFPTVSNEARFGMDRIYSGQRMAQNGVEAVSTLGLRGLDLSSVQGSGGFPSFDFSDGTNFTPIYGASRDSRSGGRSYQFTDTVSWVRGRHWLRFGIDLRRNESFLTLRTGADFGNFVFASGAFSGNAFADLLLGLPAQSSTANNGPDPHLYATSAFAFAQDTWRVGPTVTLTFGLRWGVTPPAEEAHGNLTNFDHTTGDVIVPDHSLAPAPGFLAAIGACTLASAPATCTRVLTASQAGLPQSLVKTYWGAWQPRAGFAWRPFGRRTVLRGGAGVYSFGTQTAGAMAGIHSSDYRTYVNQIGPEGPSFTLPNVGDGNFVLPPAGTATFAYGTDPTLPGWRAYDWNATIERELGWSTTARITYHGMQHTGLPILADFNQLPPSTVPYSPTRRPVPGFTRLRSAEAIGFMNYQGVQAQMERRFRNDLYFQASYTVARDLTNMAAASGWLNPVPAGLQGMPVTDRFDTRLDRGNMQGFRGQELQVSAIAPLPLGKGRLVGSNWRGTTNALLGGWELATIATAGSGTYQTPIMPSSWDASNTNAILRGIAVRPDIIPGADPNAHTGNVFFNAAAFVRPPQGAGRFGTAAPGSLVGPDLASVALGLSKTTSLGEHARLRLEASFTNVLNHPNFARPQTNISSPNFGVPWNTIDPRSGQVGARLQW